MSWQKTPHEKSWLRVTHHQAHLLGVQRGSLLPTEVSVPCSFARGAIRRTHTQLGVCGPSQSNERWAQREIHPFSLSVSARGDAGVETSAKESYRVEEEEK